MKDSAYKIGMDPKSLERFYSKFSVMYDLIFGYFFHQSRQDAIELLEIQEGHTVLEVGVGTGLSLKHYPETCKVIGIDFCEPMLEKGFERVDKNGFPHIELRKMDAMHLSFPDNSFDAVFAAYVISAVPDPHRVLSEMVRVCKVGGKIVLLNHFKNGNRMLSACEKMISPLTQKLGFQADLDLGWLLIGKDLIVEKKTSAKPLNYWKVVQCKKSPHGHNQNGPHHSGNG